MDTNDLDEELKNILWACARAKSEKNEICYRWVNLKYQERFNKTFHQSVLKKLEKMGYLQAADSVRGGGRRYYKVLKTD